MTTDRADSPAPTLDHLAVLAGLQADFLATIPLVDPAARVPWCGRWRVTDLVVHLARIHHWAASQARRRQETPLGRGPFVLVDLYRGCAAELLGTLEDLGPDAAAWTLDGNGSASFWHRRQTHETLVHLWDLRTAGGLDLDVGAAVWADTVDEVVTVMHPRQVRLGRVDAPTTAIALVAEDADRSWVVGAGPASVTVSGPAWALALLLWGRPVAPGSLTVVGDRAALDDALARGLTP